MKRFTFSVLSLSLLLAGCQQAALSPQPTVSQLPAGIELIKDASASSSSVAIPYKKYRLANGLTVVVHEDQSDPLVHVVHGYHRFRRYAPRMLRALDICAAPVAEPLLAASAIIAGTKMAAVLPLTFLRRGSKWLRHLDAEADEASRHWEVAVLFHLREAFRSGDITNDRNVVTSDN